MSEFLLNDLRAERERATRLATERMKLRARVDANPDDSGVQQRLDDIEGAHRSSTDRVLRLEADLGRHGHLRSVAANGASNREAGAFETPEHPAGTEASERRSAAFAEAEAVLEDHLRDGEITTSAADRMDEALRGDDVRIGETAQWIASHGQVAYRTAFLKMMQYGEAGAWSRFTADEQDAMQQAVRSEQFRALAEGVGSTGGFGLPISIDPSILLQSNGSINPVRSMARVRSVGAYQLRLVTTDTNAVSAAYAAEATEASDNSPTLVQPILTPRRWQAFIPYSVEMSMDYPGLQSELLTLLADAKDQLEATAFLTGDPTANQPAGILNIGGTGSLTTTQRVQTATTATLAATDIYTLRTSVPPRWLPISQWLLSPTELDSIYRLVPRASTTEPTLIDDARDKMLGANLRQWSTMASGSTTATRILLFGDLQAGYTIVDRIGLTAELIPNLFGANRRPTGQRGIFTYGRTDAAVVLPNALRYLEVK
jgi:HK97 family phage major capsid protein